MFSGFTDETFEFFMAIGFNNNRAFFLDNRAWYLRAVREPALQLAAALAPAIEKLDENLERRPQKVVSRINRDVRFSRDKSPYRDYMWIAFRRPGAERATTLGVYFDVSADGASYGMGFYDENRPLMNAFRKQLLKDPAPFLAAWRAAEGDFALHAKAYKRLAVPEELRPEARAWYNLKGFYVEREIKDFGLLKSPALVDEIRRGYEIITPMYRAIMALTPEEGGSI
jgi:uncharacterized protein (TIGR02453 family)